MKDVADLPLPVPVRNDELAPWAKKTSSAIVVACLVTATGILGVWGWQETHKTDPAAVCLRYQDQQFRADLSGDNRTALAVRIAAAQAGCPQ